MSAALRHCFANGGANFSAKKRIALLLNGFLPDASLARSLKDEAQDAATLGGIGMVQRRTE
jgi:hypothetical protein